MEIKTYLFLSIGVALLFILFYQMLSYLKNKKFDSYFQIYSEETYNLDDLYHIKLKGHIAPKKDYLDIPYKELSIVIRTTAIQGEIKENEFYLELIRPRDRKKALMLVREQYMKAVTPYISETFQNRKEDIKLIELSKKHSAVMEKIACNTCKHKIQCSISFTQCHYERADVDVLLNKGIKVDVKTSTGFSYYKG
ncbi:hypothetical protein [Alkaliphilus hydrothermalis]|uniref:Uncharacterized protein n=1 Tax=Alkaliphilus hydrothermalis TaxID=1482730 RepID=A0ABS2NSY7_9FIRM|nr:hypothetical protein [Alkaliphilus hydrothermalis]MBM7616068.1 hypothetical protein [Alkaliphilus hydrothermalis]